MSCREIEQRLDGLLDGSLPADVRRRLRAHLASCNRCRDLEAAVRGSLDVLPDAEPVDLTAEVLRRTSGSACDRARKLLPDLPGRMLTGMDNQLVRGHLEHCTECAALAAALEQTADVLPAMAEVDPGPWFTGAVLRRTTGSVPERPPSRIRSFWESLLQRPRLAWEGAYVGAFLMLLLFGTPLSPLRDVPSRALELARTNPIRVVEASVAPLPAVGARIAEYGERAWKSTGGRVVERTRPAREALGRRIGSAWSVSGSFGDHAAQGWEAFLEGDFEAIGARLQEMGQDLKIMWIRLTTAVPDSAGEEPGSKREA